MIATTDCGLAGDGRVDNAAALASCVTRASETGQIIQFPVGTFRFATRPEVFLGDVCIRGTRQVKAKVISQTVLLADYSDSTRNGFLTWQRPQAEQGGTACLEDVTIRKGLGKTGGSAIQLGSGMKRIRLSNVEIKPDSFRTKGGWTHILYADGLCCDSPSQIEDVLVTNFISDATSTETSFLLANVRNFYGVSLKLLRVGSGSPAIAVIGGSAEDQRSKNVQIVNSEIAGSVAIGNAANAVIQGAIAGDLYVAKGAENTRVAAQIYGRVLDLGVATTILSAGPPQPSEAVPVALSSHVHRGTLTASAQPIRGTMAYEAALQSPQVAPAQRATPVQSTDRTQNLSGNNTWTGTNTFADIVTRAPWIDVRAYGAIGNGIADDSAAFQAAIDASAGKSEVYIPGGTYNVNVAILHSSVSIRGAGRDTTFLQPYVDGVPVIAIDATALGATGLNHVAISDLSITNRGGFSQAEGLLIRGRLDIDQPNDRHVFQNLHIVGLRDNISIQGRTIWTSFLNVVAENASRDNLNATTRAVVNFVVFRDSRFSGAKRYGVYWNNSNKEPSQSITFDHVNIEDNGLSRSVANCSGLYLSGIGTAVVGNGSYFERNCAGTSDGKGADIRISGTYGQSISIENSLMRGSPYCIYNDAFLSTGEYSGNYLAPTRKSIYIATTHPLSKIVIGNNYDNSPHEFIADRKGHDHVVRQEYGSTSTGQTVRPMAATGTSGSANTGLESATGSVNNKTEGGLVATSVVLYSAKLTPQLVDANSISEQVFEVAGLTTRDRVIVNPPTTSNATGIVGARVSGADKLAIRFVNPTARALQPSEGVYSVIVVRP